MSAGAQQVAFAKGTAGEFDAIAAEPTYYRPGRDLTIETLQINNQAQRSREEDQPEPVESVAGNFQGRLGVSYSMSLDTHEHVRDIVFNDSGTGFTTGLPAMSRWFLGTDYLNTTFGQDTVELELRACIPLAYSIQYQQGTNTIRESLQLGFADFRKNAVLTPGSVTGPTAGSETPFHGVALTVDGSPVNRDQSIVLDFPEPLSRYHQESARTPAAAVEAGPEPTLSSTVIYHTDDYLGLSLSGDDTTATQPQDVLGDVAGSLEFSVGASTVATYTLPKLTLNQWQGQSLVDSEADFQGQANWNVDGGTSIA